RGWLPRPPRLAHWCERRRNRQRLHELATRRGAHGPSAYRWRSEKLNAWASILSFLGVAAAASSDSASLSADRTRRRSDEGTAAHRLDGSPSVRLTSLLPRE